MNAMVTTENYEEYLMMQADGELNAQELAALQAFLAKHPERAAEAATWQDLKLVPDEAIHYDHREALLKEERKAVAFRPWYAAVPVAAALLLALFLIPRTEEIKPGVTTGPIALNTAPKTTIIENPEPVSPDTKTEALPAPIPTVPGKVPTRPRRRPVPVANTVATAGATRSADVINSLQSQQASGLNIAANPVSQPVLLAMAEPAYTLTSPAGNNADGRVRVQLAAANQEALDAMKAGLDQRIDQIGRVAKSVRETTVIIKLGGNAFNIHL